MRAALKLRGDNCDVRGWKICDGIKNLSLNNLRDFLYIISRCPSLTV